MAQEDLLEVRLKSQQWSAMDLQPPFLPPCLPPSLRRVYWSKIIALQQRCDVKIFPKAPFKCLTPGTTLFLLRIQGILQVISCICCNLAVFFCCGRAPFLTERPLCSNKIGYLPCFACFALFSHK